MTIDGSSDKGRSPRLYVTGCAKTGTTLVRRLLNAFELAVYNHDEIAVDDFVASRYDAGKRARDTVFSKALPDDEIAQQLATLAEAHVSIVNVIRDRTATLASDGGYVAPERYDSCMAQADRYADHIAFTIHFEQLLADPDAVQLELGNQLGLRRIHRWSDYPRFVDVTQEGAHTRGGIYQLRPIGGPKRPTWRQRIGSLVTMQRWR